MSYYYTSLDYDRVSGKDAEFVPIIEDSSCIASLWVMISFSTFWGGAGVQIVSTIENSH